MFLLGFGNPWSGQGTIDGKMYGRVYRGLTYYVSSCAKAGLLPKVVKQFLGDAAPVAE